MERVVQCERSPRIAVLITNGYSTNKNSSIRAASALKNAGVRQFAVGITSYIDETFLRDVASAPKCWHFFYFTDDEKPWRYFSTELKMRLCEAAPERPSNSTGIQCSANDSLAFGRQKVLSTYQETANGTTIRVCARGILHAFFTREQSELTDADKFLSIKNLNASARVCKQAQMRSQGIRQLVYMYITLIGKDSEGPVAFDTECFAGLKDGITSSNLLFFTGSCIIWLK